MLKKVKGNKHFATDALSCEVCGQRIEINGHTKQTTIDRFELIHSLCLPIPRCIICGKVVVTGLPVYHRNYKVVGAMCHEACLHSSQVDYLIGHHGIVKCLSGQWHYFWRGEAVKVASKADGAKAIRALLS